VRLLRLLKLGTQPEDGISYISVPARCETLSTKRRCRRSRHAKETLSRTCQWRRSRPYSTCVDSHFARDVTRLSSTSSFPLVAVFAVCSPSQRLLPVSYLFDRPAGRDHHATRYHIYRLTAPATPQCRATWRKRRPWAVAAQLMRRRPPPRSAPQIRTAAAARSCP
jgi:hypothetical protein